MDKTTEIYEEKWLNGNIHKKGTFIKGKKTGSWKTWFQNGKKKTIGEFVDGKKSGTWVKYWKNKHLRKQGNYEAGFRSGVWSTYFENGSLKHEGTYDRDLKFGKWLFYYQKVKNTDDLRLWKEETYSEDLRNGEFIEYKDGKVKERGFYKDGLKSGIWTSTSDLFSLESWNGMTISGCENFVNKGEYIDGEKEGKWIEWLKKGRSEGNYSKGVRTGIWNIWKEQEYFYHDKFRYQGEYANGIKIGTWTKYSEKRNHSDEYKYGETIYKEDGTKYVKCWHKNGDLSHEISNAKGQGGFFTYYSCGSVLLKGEFDTKGRKTGEHIYWYQNGNVSSRIYYIEDECHGDFERFYENGNPQLKCVYFLCRICNKSHKKDFYNEWYENGQKKVERNYNLGEIIDTETKWYENGNKKSLLQYQILDRRLSKYNTGPCFEERKSHQIIWYENGNKQSEGEYLDYHKTGHWIEWHENGNKSEEGTYFHGRKIGSWIEWYENGTKKSEG